MLLAGPQLCGHALVQEICDAAGSQLDGSALVEELCDVWQIPCAVPSNKLCRRLIEQSMHSLMSLRGVAIVREMTVLLATSMLLALYLC